MKFYYKRTINKPLTLSLKGRRQPLHHNIHMNMQDPNQNKLILFVSSFWLKEETDQISRKGLREWSNSSISIELAGWIDAVLIIIVVHSVVLTFIQRYKDIMDVRWTLKQPCVSAGKLHKVDVLVWTFGEITCGLHLIFFIDDCLTS